MSQPITLVTLGDSLTAGDGDSTGNGGYPSRLLSLLTSDYPDSTLSNLAISGDTTRDLINKQLDTAVAQLNAAPAGALKMALVWIGSNDLFGLYASDVCIDYYPDLDTCESVEAGDRRDNINTILERLSATGAQVYIALLDDQTRRSVIADPSLRMDTFPGITDAEVPRMAAQIIHYNDQVKTLAAAHGATTVDFYTTTLFETPATLAGDGNHPNSSGYDAIARIWYQAVTGTALPDDTDIPDDTTPPVTPDPVSPPVPEIFSGAGTGNISVTTSETVTIFVSLDAGVMLNTPGDWWLIHVPPESPVLSLTSDLRWQETLAPVLSIPLVSFQKIPIFSNTLTTPGTHLFYFVVDNKADGLLEGPVWFDGFTVKVSASAILGATPLSPAVAGAHQPII